MNEKFLIGFWMCSCCGKRFGLDVPIYSVGNKRDHRGYLLQFCEKCYDGNLWKGDEKMVGEAARESFDEDRARLSFSTALHSLKGGHKVAREGWNGKGMWLKLVKADDWSATIGLFYVENAHRLPWIAMKTADGGLVPWLASQTDLLACDWMILE